MAWSEFFEDDTGKKSLSALLKLSAFFPSTAALFVIKTETVFIAYLSAFVLDTAITKGLNTYKSVKMKGTADAPIAPIK